MSVIERCICDPISAPHIGHRSDCPVRIARDEAARVARMSEVERLTEQLQGAVEAEREWCREIIDVDTRDKGDGRLLATLANMAAVRLRELGGR